MNNSCIMLATCLELPTSLGIIFPEHELANEKGLVFDYHITLSYAKNMLIPLFIQAKKYAYSKRRSFRLY